LFEKQTKYTDDDEPSGVLMKPLKRFLSLIAILGISAGGLALAMNGSFAIASVSDDPAGPLTLLLRVLLGTLSVWVGGLTLVAATADAFGFGRIAAGACSLLPRSVSKVVRRSIGIGVMTSVLMSSPAFAGQKVPSAAPSGQSVEQQYSGDVGNGQRWPAKAPLESTVSDSDAPTLIALTQRSSSRPTTTDPSLDAVNRNSRLSVPPTSAPSGGVISIPQPTRTGVVPSSPTTTITHRTLAPGASQATSAAPVEPYTVVPGDHFWSIARRVVTKHNPNASESTVGEYCHRLIQHNRARLHDPHNPDLLHVGTKLELPAVDVPA
jgi:hypothetical protein